MSGTVLTERVAGIPSGYPAEIDSSVKVRFVAPVLMNMSETSTDFLKYIGGAEKFNFDNTKIEWVEDDIWNRRLTHTGLAAGTTTSLVVTGAAHRYPIGTILFNVPDSEYVRVTGHIDANTLLIARDINATVTEGAWASTDEVFVVGLSMDENDDWVFRPTSIFTLPYNLPQVFQTGVQASYRRQETRLYGLTGSDLDHQSQRMVEEQFVMMEMAALHSPRFAGSVSVPSTFGGVKYYLTAANGAQVTDMASAPLTRKDIDDILQLLYYSVGPEKMAKTIMTSVWGRRKIDSFFSGAERMPPTAGGAGGITISRLNTAFGPIDLMTHMALQQNEMLLLRQDQIQMGHHGSYGRPHLAMLPTSTVGPRSQKVFYGDLSMTVKGVQAMARIHSFSVTS